MLVRLSVLLPARPSVRASLVPALLLPGALLAALPALGQPSPPRSAARPALTAGPMLGYVTHRDALVWAQTDRAARVSVRYRVEGSTGRWTTAPDDAATAEDGFTAHVRLNGLEPGTRYAYEVLVNGRAVPRPYPTVVATQPLWQWRTDPPAFTVAIGSCAYVNEPAYDRPGTPYGAEYRIFGSIARLRPDAMVWMGDNTYLREVDWWTPEGMDRRYRHTRSLPELQPLLASTAHYATWDDHDYGPNDADRAWVHKGAALDLFRRYWGNLSYGLPETPGVFGHFQLADADVFLLDDRYHKAPNGLPHDDPAKAYLGEAQLAWLLDALTTSRAPFKIVVNGGQVLNPVAVYETMSTHAVERQRLLDELARRRIPGVLFLSGDRHLTELHRLDRPGAYPLYDFTSSSLTAGSSRPHASEVDSPTRVPGTLLTERNFGTLTFAGPRESRTLTLRTYDAGGALRWQHVLRAADLTYPGR